MSVFAGCVNRMDAVIETVYGDAVQYYPRVGTDYEINGVLDSGQAVQQGERVYQTFWAPLANFTGGEPVKGDHIVFDSVTYRVADIDKHHLDGRMLFLQVTNPIA